MDQRTRHLVAASLKRAAQLLLASKADDLMAKYPDLADDIDLLAQSDPSGTYKYLTWQTKILTSGADPQEIIDAVVKFHKALPQMPPKFKDFLRLKSLEEMNALSERFQVSKSKMDKGVLKKEGQRPDTEYLYEDEDFLIINPRTMAASCYYGKGTTWCISRDDERNYFSEYEGKNVTFYFLIDKRQKPGSDWAKVAMLFSEGKTYVPEPFQNAANALPSKSQVQGAIGPEFEKLYSIAQEHAVKNPDNESFKSIKNFFIRVHSPEFMAKDYDFSAIKNSLRNADLQGADLAGAQLQVADLLYAKLQGAILQDANLQGANLFGAKLEKADLQGAQLQHAILKRTQLDSADLQKTNLQHATLNDAKGQGADFRGADLRETDFSNAQFRQAKFQGANLGGTDLRVTQFQGAQFQGANLFAAKMQSAGLKEVDFQGAVLQHALLWGADLRKANLRGANLQRAEFDAALLHGVVGFPEVYKDRLSDDQITQVESWS